MTLIILECDYFVFMCIETSTVDINSLQIFIQRNVT